MGVNERDFGLYSSAIDYTNLLKHGKENGAKIPDGRRPYVLAQFALSLYGDSDSRPQFRDEAKGAFETLYNSNLEGTLQPPLSDDLAEEVKVFVDGRHSVGGKSTAFILAWVIDHGSVNSVPHHRHSQELIS